MIVGCTAEQTPQEMQVTTNVGVVAERVPGDVDTLPRLRYGDGLVSLNDRCMVRHLELNPKMPPVYVSGRPVGFC